jgi:hypothetical protein
VTHWLLSVDPGTHAAWVLWECSGSTWTPVRVGRAKAPSACDCRALLGQLLPDWSEAVVVVEGQFYSGRKGQSPFQDVARLMELRCAWQHAAELAGATVEVVAPWRWIPAISSGAPGETTKQRIKWVVARLLPGLRLRADEFDAAGLGCWWVQGHGGKVRVGEPGGKVASGATGEGLQ